ncbi:MAG: hypothetical protein ABI355_10685 [Solirubrobacteraceae bacterium]
MSTQQGNEQIRHLTGRARRADDRMLEAVVRLIHDAHAGRPRLARQPARSAVTTPSVLTPRGKNADAPRR